MSDPQQAALNNLLENVTIQTNQVFDSLVVNAGASQLDEQIFKEYFLPYFSGQVPITRETSVLSDWVSVAGTATKSVDVINNKGEVLFTVPGLFNTDSVVIGRSGTTGSLSDIYSNYELKKNNLPVIATKYLAGALNDKLDTTVTESGNGPGKQAWDAILTRYGLNAVTSTSVADDNDGVDDLVYD